MLLQETKHQTAPCQLQSRYGMCMCSMVVVWYHTTTTFGTNHHTTPKCAMRFLITTLVMVALLFLSRLIELQALTYYYFALGSNVDPSTMMSLRNLSPRRAQPAVLPGYRLAFNVKGNSWIEPSACSALKSRKYPNDTIHGVLYELARADFLSLSFSEGVPRRDRSGPRYGAGRQFNARSALLCDPQCRSGKRDDDTLRELERFGLASPLGSSSSKETGPAICRAC